MPPTSVSLSRRYPVGLSTRSCPGLRRCDAKTGIVAAVLIIEIIDERPFLAIGKHDPRQAQPAAQRRGPFLNNGPLAPLGVAPVVDLVAHPQINAPVEPSFARDVDVSTGQIAGLFQHGALTVS
jgi:hypothetical protein